MRGLPDDPCSCTDTAVHRYLTKLSGPILDRIDLHLHLQPVTPRQLLFGTPGESSATVRARVVAARRRQAERGQPAPNGQLSDRQIAEVSQLTAAARRLVADLAEHHNLSARAATRLVRVARTVADLRGEARVHAPCVQEAQTWRSIVSA